MTVSRIPSACLSDPAGERRKYRVAISCFEACRMARLGGMVMRY
jgi:hypothetical protein